MLLPSPSLDFDIGMHTSHFREMPATGVGADMFLAARIVDDSSTFSGTAITEGKKPLALDLAIAAAEQFVTMCRMNEPRRSGGEVEVLDGAGHDRLFTWPAVVKKPGGLGIRMEGSRDSALFGGRIHRRRYL
ncbi:hypothetical protein HPP92_002944 [Vanilla planifolia]|uniref:Uncharacterized protein n=1 Tax=Vanilla planifolia TaxID=51239 RepID=A0A835SEP3_VANPL|nr:hypothetical protein HPP92_002944 [Vanilla planifolia]